MSKCPPDFNHHYKYRWTFLVTGSTGVKEWHGYSRQEFLNDLDKWNGTFYWKYEEVVECPKD